MTLNNKIALITGCSGGIGKATAVALAKLGCNIAVHYSQASAIATEIVKQLTAMGVRAQAFQADFGDYDAVRRLYEEVVETLGPIDILFNNAGVANSRLGRHGNIESLSLEEFENTWKVNTGSGFLLTQLCIPNMEKQKYGRVVFCSSVAAGTGGIIGPHYASSKSALHGLLHWIAVRYAKDGITCNAVAPALITETTMMANVTDEVKSTIPVGRMGHPEEIASIVEMLVQNGYVTNKIIVADGGMTPTAF